MKKDLVKEENLDITKIKSNIFFACYDCKFEWNMSDYIDKKENAEGEICPNCGGKNICAT